MSLRLTLAPLLVAFSLCAHAGPARVEWKSERLTIKAQDAPLREVLREIGQQTGTPIQGLDNVAGAVTIDIEAAPLPAALNQLLAKRAYAMTTLTAKPPGRSGIELQFPPPPSAAKGSGRTSPPAQGTIVEESWVGPDGKPRLEITSRPLPAAGDSPRPASSKPPSKPAG